MAGRNLILLFLMESAWAVSSASSNEDIHVLEYVILCQTQQPEKQIDYYADNNELGYFDYDKNEIIPRIAKFNDFFADQNNQDFATYTSVNNKDCNAFLKFALQSDSNAQEVTVEPVISVYPVTATAKGKPNTLICVVNRFFPAAINITWMKNGDEVTDGVSSTQYYSNDDFTFLMYKYLSVTLESGDIYTCTVEHQSLQEPRTVVWETDFEDDYGSGTAFCVLGLLIGVAGVTVGIILFIKAKKSCSS